MKWDRRLVWPPPTFQGRSCPNSPFVLVTFLGEEPLVRSLPARAKHLELVCLRLGKNRCQQLTTTYKSFMEDAQYLPSPEDWAGNGLFLPNESMLAVRCTGLAFAVVYVNAYKKSKARSSSLLVVYERAAGFAGARPEGSVPLLCSSCSHPTPRMSWWHRRHLPAMPAPAPQERGSALQLHGPPRQSRRSCTGHHPDPVGQGLLIVPGTGETSTPLPSW